MWIKHKERFYNLNKFCGIELDFTRVVFMPHGYFMEFSDDKIAETMFNHICIGIADDWEYLDLDEFVKEEDNEDKSN